MLRDENRQVVEVGSAQVVGASHWTALSAGHSLYSSFDWIQHADLMPDGTPGHLVLREAGRPVAALPSYRFERTRPVYYDAEEAVGLGNGLGPEAGAGRPRPPAWVGGTRLGYTGELLTGPLTDPDRRGRAACALLDAFRRRCAVRSEPGAMLYLTDDSLDTVLGGLDDGDQVVLMDGSVDLAVPPGGLDGYRATVSKSRWEQFQREMRRFERAGCEVRVLAMGERLEEMGALALAVSLRYGHDRTLQEEIDKLRDQAERLRDGVVMTAFHRGEMVGFTQFFLREKTMYGRGHGVSEEYGRRASIYFNLTYYAAVRWAAEHGYQRIDLGSGSFDAKVIRGGQLRPRWALMIEPGWSDRQTRQVRGLQQALLNDLRAVDERVITPTLRAVAERHGWEGLLSTPG